MEGLIIGETDGRKMPQPPVGVLNNFSGRHAVGGGYLHLQAFHEKYDEVNGPNAQRYNFPATSVRRELCEKLIPASLCQLLLQLQSTASLLQWPCMMLLRWVLSKLFACDYLSLSLFKPF